MKQDQPVTVAVIAMRVAIGSIALGLSVSAAYAAAPDDPSDTQSATLTEIVVTAQRRSQNLQDVPITISVVNPQLLASGGISDSLGLGAVV